MLCSDKNKGAVNPGETERHLDAQAERGGMVLDASDVQLWKRQKHRQSNVLSAGPLAGWGGERRRLQGLGTRPPARPSWPPALPASGPLLRDRPQTPGPGARPARPWGPDLPGPGHQRATSSPLPRFVSVCLLMSPSYFVLFIPVP